MKKEETSHELSNKPRVTYGDIAKELSISKMSVSLAMRNDPRISEATRIKVHNKAVEMNYRPDPVLSALSKYRSLNHEKVTNETLAWINFYQSPEQQRRQKEFHLYWKGAQQTALQLGFNLEEFRFKELSLEQMHHTFKARGIQGIILTPVPRDEAPPPDELNAFPWEDYSIVRFGQCLPSLKVNFISSAQASNTILTFEQMRAKGYQRIGFAGGYMRQQLFSAGYLWAQQALPASQQLAPLYFNNQLQQLGSLLDHWIKQQKPDAIICGNDHILKTLEKMGYVIPRDLGLATVSKCDIPLNAGIDQKPEEIGRIAIRTLVSQLKENSYGIPITQKETLVKGQWFNGTMLPSRL